MPTSERQPEAAPPRRREGRLTSRALLGLLLGFAVLGAAALVVSDDVRWLRLGIVAALWAALVGAFAAARYRRESAADHDRSEELRRVYELELEREVAARREYELEVETDTRRRVEEEVRNEVRHELDGLRTELRTLRQNLEALLGGEVLVERVALRAESTRLRSLSDQSRAARSADRALPQAPPRAGRPRRADGARAFNEVQDAEVISSRLEPAARGEQAARAEQGRPRVAPVAPRGESRPRVDPAETTDIMPRYQGPYVPPSAGGPHLPPPAGGPARQAPNPHELTQTMEFKQPTRREPTGEQPLRSPLSAQPPTSPPPSPPTSSTPPPQSRPRSTPQEPASQQRSEPPMADRIYAEPAPGTAWDGSWKHPEPSQSPNGNGSTPHRRRAVDDEPAPTYTGGRRRADEDSSDGRSVKDLLASIAEESEPRRRHRRDER